MGTAVADLGNALFTSAARATGQGPSLQQGCLHAAKYSEVLGPKCTKSPYFSRPFLLLLHSAQPLRSTDCPSHLILSWGLVLG